MLTGRMRQNITEFSGGAFALVISKQVGDQLRKRDASGKLTKMKTSGKAELVISVWV